MRRFFWVILVFVVLILLLLSLKNRNSSNYSVIPLSSFYTLMNQGSVARVQVEGNELLGTLSRPELINGRQVRDFRTVLPSGATGDWRFLQWLIEHSNNAVIEVEQENSVLTNFVLPLIPWLLIFFFIWFFVFRRLRAGSAPGTPMPVIVVNPEGR